VLRYAGRQGVIAPARRSTRLRALKAFTAHMIAPGYVGENHDLPREPGSLAKRPDGTWQRSLRGPICPSWLENKEGHEAEREKRWNALQVMRVLNRA
jgi:hypothetical protein